MQRLRAILLSAGVTLTVFTYLALPVLREWYGPAVDLVVYAALSLVAGGLTYTLVRGTQGRGGERTGERAFDEEVERLESADEEEIEEMLRELNE